MEVKEGDIFGEMEAISREPRISRAVSLGKSSILILPKASYQCIFFEEYQDVGKDIARCAAEKRKAWNNHLKKILMTLGSIEPLYFKPPSYALLLIKGVHEVTGLINKAEKDQDTSKNSKTLASPQNLNPNRKHRDTKKQKTNFSASGML